MTYRTVLPFLATLLCTTAAFPQAAQEEKQPTPQAQEQEEQKPHDDPYENLQVLGSVLDLVQSNYVDDISQKEVVTETLKSLLASLDPHSSYITEEDMENTRIQTIGKFGGLGIEVTMENGLIKIISPIDETPAARAKLEPGDLIIEIDGEPVMGMTLNDAIDRMRGDAGTPITVKILRGQDEPFDVTIVRDIIKIQSVRHKTIDDTVGYIRIRSFNASSYEMLEKAVKDIEDNAENIKGYILDLRNNPGGLLNQAVQVSDAFLEKGEIVSTRGRDDQNVQRWDAKAGDLINGKPLIILINEGSASAAEIVSGALKDHGRALLIGTRSFGKGSVQTIIPLKGYGAVRMTTARYYTPAGISIQAKGIAPDILAVPAKLEKLEYHRRREADLRGALDTSEEDEATPADTQSSETEKQEKATDPKPANDNKTPQVKEENASEEKNVSDEKTPEEKLTPEEELTEEEIAEKVAEKFFDPKIKNFKSEELLDYQLLKAIDLIKGVSFFKE